MSSDSRRNVSRRSGQSHSGNGYRRRPVRGSKTGLNPVRRTGVPTYVGRSNHDTRDSHGKNKGIPVGDLKVVVLDLNDLTSVSFLGRQSHAGTSFKPFDRRYTGGSTRSSGSK